MFRKIFNKDKPPRVLQDHSVREITDLKKKLNTELRASLYFYNEEKFIVCSIADIVEYGTPAILDINSSDKDLGLALCNKLLEFKPQSGGLRLSGKLEDWAAFKASGAATGKSFENNSMFVYFRTVNTAINMEAAPRVSLEQELKAFCSISNGLSHSEMGRAIRKVIAAANVLRQAKIL